MGHSETEISDLRTRLEMEFLAAIERGEVVSQASLTQRIGASVGMVNALVKRAVGKGYAKMRQAPYKRYAYYLTPQGFAEKSRLVAQYLDASLSFFRTARSEYETLFTHAKRDGKRHILLCGEGELLEIAVIAAMAEGVALAGVLTLGTTEDDAPIFGLPRQTALGSADLVVLTDRHAPQERFEALKALAGPDRAVIVAPPFLKIAPDRAALIAHQKNAAPELESA